MIPSILSARDEGILLAPTRSRGATHRKLALARFLLAPFDFPSFNAIFKITPQGGDLKNLHGMRESNPRQRFWRPLYCHYTNPALASPAARLTDYFISLCIVCFLHFLQNFFISNFSLSFFLFRVVK